MEEASGDKREKSEDDGLEEEENGWWAERVVGALGGLGDYGDTWYRSHAHLLHGDGPLPHTWRLYIAALVGVSSCPHCLAFYVHEDDDIYLAACTLTLSYVSPICCKIFFLKF